MLKNDSITPELGFCREGAPGQLGGKGVLIREGLSDEL